MAVSPHPRTEFNPRDWEHKALEPYVHLRMFVGRELATCFFPGDGHTCERHNHATQSLRCPPASHHSTSSRACLLPPAQFSFMKRCVPPPQANSRVEHRGWRPYGSRRAGYKLKRAGCKLELFAATFEVGVLAVSSSSVQRFRNLNVYHIRHQPIHLDLGHALQLATPRIRSDNECRIV